MYAMSQAEGFEPKLPLQDLRHLGGGAWELEWGVQHSQRVQD